MAKRGRSRGNSIPEAKENYVHLRARSQQVRLNGRRDKQGGFTEIPVGACARRR